MRRNAAAIRWLSLAAREGAAIRGVERGDFLVSLAQSRARAGDRSGARGSLLELEGIADRSRDHATASGWRRDAACVWNTLGDGRACRRALDAALRYALEVEDPYFRGGAVENVNAAAALCGEWGRVRLDLEDPPDVRLFFWFAGTRREGGDAAGFEDFLARGREVLRAQAAGRPPVRDWVLAHARQALVELLLDVGRVEEALREARPLVRDRIHAAGNALWLAQRLAHAGDAARARRWTARCRALVRQKPGDGSSALGALCDVARLCLEAGDARGARATVKLADEIAARSPLRRARTHRGARNVSIAPGVELGPSEVEMWRGVLDATLAELCAVVGDEEGFGRHLTAVDRAVDALSRRRSRDSLATVLCSREDALLERLDRDGVLANARMSEERCGRDETGGTITYRKLAGRLGAAGRTSDEDLAWVRALSRSARAETYLALADGILRE